MVAVIWLVLFVLVLFSAGYLGYSKYLAGFVELDESAKTPAHKYEDGQEYVPAKKPVLLGHHYSSIAGGAPIVGPITAGIIWGWIPSILWIAIGNPLLGSVHDFVSLSGSLRHEGKSIGHIIGTYVGDRGKNMLLWFAFLTIILVVAVFALVVGIVFDAYPSAATASLLYIALALLFGVYLYQLDLPFIPGTALFVIGVFASVFVGIRFPIALAPGGYDAVNAAGYQVITLTNGLGVPSIVNADVSLWVLVVLVYAFLASVLPVWMLLQPRDYLSSFLLYAGVGGALLAIIVGSVYLYATGGDFGPLTTQIPGWNGFGGIGTSSDLEPYMPLFPLLFVTIACGTISGFHSLVSSGTTAKQLNKETDARVIGYGGMLGEGLLATVALSTVAIVGFAGSSGGIGLALPNFAKGGGVIFNTIGIPVSYGAPFMALVMVSFLLTSTDTAVRLGRYLFEELVGTPETSIQKTTTNRYVNSGIQCVGGYFLLASGSWSSLWPLFGSANQLLAALALLTATVWLANWDKSKQLISTGVPMILMAITTICAFLWLAFITNLQGKLLNSSWMAKNGTVAQISVSLQIVIALVLVGLAISVIWFGYNNIKSVRGESGQAVTDGGRSD